MPNVEIKKLQEDLQVKIAQVEAKSKELDEAKEKLLLGNGGNHMSGIVGSSSTSLEQQALRCFGASDLKSLINVNVAAPKFNRIDLGLKQFVINLKSNINTSRLISQMFYGEAQDRDGKEDVDAARVKSVLENNYAKSIDLAGQIKAFGSTVSGQGDEFVPTLLASQYIEEYELEKKVAGLFKQIPMGSNPYELPVKTGMNKARKATEGTSAVTTGSFGTAKLTFNAVKPFEFYDIPEELNEDSAPVIIEIGRMEIAEAHLRAIESAILNGDTTATHMDSDTHAAGADVAEKFWMGLRKRALANTANGSVIDFGAGVTTTKLDAMRKAIGKFGVNVSQLCWLVSPNAWNQMVAMDQVSTVDKFGPMATILSGALASYRGIPIVVSEHMRDDLNASGVYDGVTTDNSSVILVNKTRFMLGMRRPLRIKAQMSADLAMDKWQLVGWQRIAFTGHTQSATEKSVSIGVNVTV